MVDISLLVSHNTGKEVSPCESRSFRSQGFGSRQSVKDAGKALRNGAATQDDLAHVCAGSPSVTRPIAEGWHALAGIVARRLRFQEHTQAEKVEASTRASSALGPVPTPTGEPIQRSTHLFEPCASVVRQSGWILKAISGCMSLVVAELGNTVFSWNVTSVESLSHGKSSITRTATGRTTESKISSCGARPNPAEFGSTTLLRRALMISRAASVGLKRERAKLYREATKELTTA